MRARPRLAVLLFTCLAACSAGDGSDDELARETSTAASETTVSETEATGVETGTDDASDTGGDALVMVSGDAFAFGPSTMIASASVSVLEQPELSTTTDDAGHFSLALPGGSTATFVLDKPGHPRVYTKTFTLPEQGVLERVTFQVPDDATFAALATIVDVAADPATCQLASTVTRVGKSLYDEGSHGEPGATVTIEPALPPEHGPIYFNAQVIPQKDLIETSDDGGILYTNVPPGIYVLRASKAGVEFEDVTIRCDADVLVNPSPPHGLQAL
jgi:hypothetical protein